MLTSNLMMKLYLIFGSLLSTVPTYHCQKSPFKVAIIGRGIAGASCASKLREIFGSDVAISVFDGGPASGRAQTMRFNNGAAFDAGATIIHKRNRLMVKYLRETNLSRCDADGKMVLTIFNGVKPAFVGSTFWLWNMAKLFWRYNFDLVNIRKDVAELLDNFDNIYRLQDEERAFADLESLLAAWSPNFSSLLTVSLSEKLRSKGYSERFIDELVNAATRNNYNQRADSIHAFVGYVALAGFLPGLFFTDGGNERIPDRLFKEAEVVMVPSAVTKIEETSGTLSTPSYAVHLEDGRSFGDFDFVVLAAPRYPNSSQAWPSFQNVAPDLPPFDSSPYQPVTTTCVRGRLNTEHFRLPKDGATASTPYAILMAGRARTDPVNSVAYSPDTSCEAPKSGRFVWKVYTNDTRPLSSEMLDRLFSSREEVIAKHWSGAYPRYSVPQAVKGRKFLLAPGLIATSPIETIASALEMSAVSGVNAALLIRAARGASAKMSGHGGSGRNEAFREEL